MIRPCDTTRRTPGRATAWGLLGFWGVSTVQVLGGREWRAAGVSGGLRGIF